MQAPVAPFIDAQSKRRIHEWIELTRRCSFLHCSLYRRDSCRRTLLRFGTQNASTLEACLCRRRKSPPCLSKAHTRSCLTRSPGRTKGSCTDSCTQYRSDKGRQTAMGSSGVPLCLRSTASRREASREQEGEGGKVGRRGWHQEPARGEVVIESRKSICGYVFMPLVEIQRGRGWGGGLLKKFLAMKQGPGLEDISCRMMVGKICLLSRPHQFLTLNRLTFPGGRSQSSHSRPVAFSTLPHPAST